MTTKSGMLFGLPACTALLLGCERPVAELGYQLRRTLPHDTLAYTQGLLLHDGVFFESTGRYGESEVRQVDVATGRVLRRHALDGEHFGEGLARVGDRLIQLTWKAGLAFVYDAATLLPADTFKYEGEGWGLCHDGESLFMSDGSGTCSAETRTFRLTEAVAVTRDGFSVRNLNELGAWGITSMPTSTTMRIDKETRSSLDAFPLSLSDAGAVPDPPMFTFKYEGLHEGWGLCHDGESLGCPRERTPSPATASRRWPF